MASYKEKHVVLAPDQKGLQFYVDKKKAKKVFDLLVERLRKKGPPYNRAHVPQADQFLPANLEKGAAEHAVFLFMLCLWMRGGVESDTAASFLGTMYEREPELFRPSNYRDCGDIETARQIARTASSLKRHNLDQRVDENAPGWVYNMRKLDRFWQGDPRNLMNDQPTFDILTDRIIGKTRGHEGSFSKQDSPNGFMFFREKMVAMIAYFLLDSGLVPMFYTPVPVDFHVLRILTANGILRVRGRSIKDVTGINFMRATTLELSRSVTEWYCRKHRVSPIALCDALWLLSRNLCRDNPGNSGYVINSHGKKDVEEEPTWFKNTTSSHKKKGALDEDTGRKRYRGMRWSKEEILDSPAKVERLKRSCGKCPINSTCQYNISSGAYYVGGLLLPERLRVIPSPDTHIQGHFLDHPAFESVRHEDVDPTVRFTKIHLDA